MLCDHRPDLIEDMKRAGYNATKANKDVIEGIDAVKSYPLVIDKDSYNLIKELQRYRWKQNGDTIEKVVVKAEDELCDALRYCIYWYHIHNKVSGPTFKFKIRTT